MFAGLESTREHSARPWTAAASFTAQAGIVAALLILPLLHPQNLSEALFPRRVFVPARVGYIQTATPPNTHPTPGSLHLRPIIVNNSIFVFHRQIEAAVNEVAQAPSIGDVLPSGTESGVQHSILNEFTRVMPRAAATVHPLRVSVMMEGNLFHKVEPLYPSLARQAGIQGSVVIRAFISRSGAIERAELVSGHPLLSRAALDAVRQWQYRPYYLNGEPVEVETQITVNFVLQR
jgi:protein TonB